MFLPLHDDNPRIFISVPWVTYAVIAACVTLFLFQISGSEQLFVEAVYAYGSIPAVVMGDERLPAELHRIPVYMTLITSAFLHADWLHLLGNMLFLWVFGDNIEDAMGHGRFIVFYLVCTLAAALSHIAIDPASVVPMVGASGAISGVLGAYLLLYPRAKILIPIGFIPLYLPAWLCLSFWFAFQFLMAAEEGVLEGGGVAWYAHIGGFIAGMVLIPGFKHKGLWLFGGRAKPGGIMMRSQAEVYEAKMAETQERSRSSNDGPWTD